MKAQAASWLDYWERDEFWFGSELWKINAELFFREVQRFIEFKKTDNVANLGCGAGYLERLLAPRVKAIHAFDTARHFVETCRENCRSLPNVQASLLDGDYTDITRYGERFSLVFCLSVVQYYRDKTEVEALIRSTRKVALPGARMLIADLPLKRGLPGFCWDDGCSLLLSLREGYFGSLLRTTVKGWRKFYDYRTFCKKTPPLLFSREEIKGLVRRMNLNAQIITNGLSIHANRPSLLIRF